MECVAQVVIATTFKSWMKEQTTNFPASRDNQMAYDGAKAVVATAHLCHDLKIVAIEIIHLSSVTRKEIKKRWRRIVLPAPPSGFCCDFLAVVTSSAFPPKESGIFPRSEIPRDWSNNFVI